MLPLDVPVPPVRLNEEALSLMILSTTYDLKIRSVAPAVFEMLKYRLDLVITPDADPGKFEMPIEVNSSV